MNLPEPPRPKGLLLASAGIRWIGRTLPTLDDLEATPGAIEALMEAAHLYVQAGGVPSLSEWAEMGAAERAALVAARTRFYASTVASLASAIQSPAVAAEVASLADGGATKRRAALHEAVAGVVAAVRGAAGGGA